MCMPTFFFLTLLTANSDGYLEHLQQPLQIFVLFEERTVYFTFYLSTFSNTLFKRLFIPFKYYFFILSLIFLFQSSFNHLILMRSSMFLIQYFHNKSYVVSYY